MRGGIRSFCFGGEGDFKKLNGYLTEERMPHRKRQRSFHTVGKSFHYGLKLREDSKILHRQYVFCCAKNLGHIFILISNVMNVMKLLKKLNSAAGF